MHRLKGRLAGRTGLSALREVLADNLPLDEERAQETALEVGFWGRSLAGGTLLEVQREEAAELRYLVRTLLDAAAEAGEISTGEDLGDVTERLLALVDGLSVHRLLYPDRISTEVLQRLMAAELDRLTP